MRQRTLSPPVAMIRVYNSSLEKRFPRGSQTRQAGACADDRRLRWLSGLVRKFGDVSSTASLRSSWKSELCEEPREILSRVFPVERFGALLVAILEGENMTLQGKERLEVIRPKDDPTPPPPSDGDSKNPTVNFHGEKRSNRTHESVTDPDARLARKGSGTTSALSHLGSVLMDNRHGLIVATDVRPPGYESERDAAVEMLTTLEPRRRRRTVGADKGYDTADFVEGARECNTTPHVARDVHANRRESAIDERTTRHDGYAVSQVKRKLVEEGFGWSKTIGGLRKLHHRGREKVGWIFTFTNAAYDLVRIRTLIRSGVCNMSAVGATFTRGAQLPRASHRVTSRGWSAIHDASAMYSRPT